MVPWPGHSCSVLQRLPGTSREGIVGTTGRGGEKGTVCGGVRNGNQHLGGEGRLGLSFSYLGAPRSAVQMGPAIPGQLDLARG